MPHRAIIAALIVSCSFRLQPESRGLRHQPESRGLRHQPESRGFSSQAESPRFAAHLQIRGTRFINNSGGTFDWRGISAFRLVEFVAHGREKDAEAYLAWASGKKLTLVRVLTMADVLFKLS